MFDRIGSEISVGSIERDILIDSDEASDDMRTRFEGRENVLGKTMSTTMHVSARQGRLRAQVDYEGRVDW